MGWDFSQEGREGEEGGAWPVFDLRVYATLLRGDTSFSDGKDQVAVAYEEE